MTTSLAAVKLPSGDAVTRAVELVRAAAPKYLVNHSLRSLAFGRCLAARDNKTFDLELVAVAAVLHDIGLARRYRGPACFERRSADVAASFLTALGWSSTRIAVVTEAIVGHMGDDPATSAEAAVLDAGISYDVSGRRYEDIGPAERAVILGSYPRLGFKRRFIAAFERETRMTPECSVAILMSQRDLATAVRRAPFPS